MAPRRDPASALFHKLAQRLCARSVQQRVKLHVAAHAGSKPVAIRFAQCSDARRTVLVANFAIAISASIVEAGAAGLGQGVLRSVVADHAAGPGSRSDRALIEGQEIVVPVAICMGPQIGRVAG